MKSVEQVKLIIQEIENRIKELNFHLEKMPLHDRSELTTYAVILSIHNGTSHRTTTFLAGDDVLTRVLLDYVRSQVPSPEELRRSYEEDVL